MNIKSSAINKNCTNNYILEEIIKSFFILLFSSYFIFNTGEFLELTLKSAAYGLLIVIILQSAWLVRIILLNYSNIKIKQLISIVALSILTGIITCSINRPDIDDSVYASKAVFYVENPDSTLDKSITWIAGTKSKINSFDFQYYETTQSALAYLLGVKYLSVYHILMPFIIGSLAFLSIYLLLGCFHENEGIKIIGSVWMIVIYLIYGAEHRSLGNFTIARAFQGKAVLFYLGFYVWTYFSIKFFERKNKKDMAILSIIGVALTALTSTTFFYLPFLSGILYVAYYFSKRYMCNVRILKIGLLYAITLMPLIIIAINYRRIAMEYFPMGSTINAGFSQDFWVQLSYVFGLRDLLEPTLLFASFIIVALYSRHKIFFIVWVLLPCLTILNPYTSNFIMKNFTTENAYWRLFYILPIPLVTIVSLCTVIEKMNSKIFGQILTSIFLISLLTISSGKVLRKENNANFELFSIKMNEHINSVVIEISDGTIPGTMFAPLELASNLVIYTSKYKQYYGREDFYDLTLQKYNVEDGLLERKLTAKYLYGDLESSAYKDIFHKFIKVNRPDYVVLKKGAINTIESTSILIKEKYHDKGLESNVYKLFEANRV